MRSHWRSALGAVVASISCAADPATAQIFGPSPAPAPRSATIVGAMGLEMSESAARHAIAFAPFAPFRRIVAVALIPPFRGDDVRSNRGIAFEYADEKNRRYVLAEWPANGGRIDRFSPLTGSEASCPVARVFSRGAKPNGIVWSTPRGLIMTLQADGVNDARTLRIEWRKLVRRGACR